MLLAGSGLLLAVGLETALRLAPPAVRYRWTPPCAEVRELHEAYPAPIPGTLRQRFDRPEVYGEQVGFEYDETYNELGIKLSQLRPQGGDGVRVLFLGDSFMQGYDDPNTIAQRAYEWVVAHRKSDQPLIILNAAYTSYSPLIYAAQARHLLPVVKPDYVVVDIDETDLFDDAVRYRPRVERDDQGLVIAIRPETDRRAWIEACERTHRSPLLLLRAIGARYYPARMRWDAARKRRGERPLAVPETEEYEFSEAMVEQVRSFSESVDEMLKALTSQLAAERILIVRHPHLRHIDAGSGWVLNRRVGEVVAEAAARHGVTFFDAQDEMTDHFGQHPERYYWNVDTRFNFEGVRLYGELVGRELLRKLEPDQGLGPHPAATVR